MYEFGITCARTLWNVDKDLLDLLIYMQASAGQHLLVLACIYFSFLVFALFSLLSCGSERSEAEPDRS